MLNAKQAAHYGLPAAGIICLSMIQSPFWEVSGQSQYTSKVLQDLTVFVVEIQFGGLVEAGEPNYALLQRATSSIQSLLKVKLSAESTNNESRDIQDPTGMTANFVNVQPFDIIPQESTNHADVWGFEYSFWQNLGEHPLLISPQPPTNFAAW